MAISVIALISSVATCPLAPAWNVESRINHHQGADKKTPAEERFLITAWRKSVESDPIDPLITVLIQILINSNSFHSYLSSTFC